MTDYTPEQYTRLLKKIDRYLLPLMWCCYGIQQTDKTSLGTQAVRNIIMRMHTMLTLQRYLASGMIHISWVKSTNGLPQCMSRSSVRSKNSGLIMRSFYIAYLCGEFPSNFLLQRWALGRTLSIYMLCWGKLLLQCS